MVETDSGSQRPNVLLSIACVLIIIGGLKLGRPVLVPIMVATFLTVITYPLLRFYKRVGFSKGMAIFFVVSMVLAFIGGLIWLLGDSADAFAEDLPERSKQATESLAAWLQNNNIIEEKSELSDGMNTYMAAFATSIAASLATAATDLVLICILLCFMLLEAESFPSKVEVAFGSERSHMARLKEYELDLQRYLLVKTLTSAITGICVGLLCWAVGLEYAFLLAVIAFLLNFIPTVGSIIASVPGIVLASSLGLAHAAGIAVGYFAINLVIGNLLEPQIMGRKLGLAPLIVFLSFFFWGWMWGPIGMLLSVPLTMALKIYMEHTQDFQWAAILLGREPIAPKLPPNLENQ